MDKIKFGHDGWRAIIAKDYTVDSVARISLATAIWLTRKYKNPSVVMGYDCRFNGELFMETAAKVLASKGVRVFLSEHFITSPMVSLGIVKIRAQCGIVFTASHFSAEYNGFKLMGDHGGTMAEKDLKDIESLISSDLEIDLDMLNWNYMLEQGTIMYLDLEGIYLKELNDRFDIRKIADSGLRLAFDAMYGSSQNIMKKVLPDNDNLHCVANPLFGGIPPEPTRKNLHELIEYIWKRKDIDCSLATDGDGDRIAIFDREANFYDANKILLLLIHCLAGYKQLKGKVLVSFPTTGKIERICEAYQIESMRFKVGFSEASKMMSEQDVLLAGEESGGIAIGGHVPEFDAVWAGMIIWQWMAETGKALDQLYEEVISITGPFAFERASVEMNRNNRTKITEQCSKGSFTSFGRFVVSEFEIYDGFKFFLNPNEWLLIRPSSNEPLLRIYAEAENVETAQEIIYSAMKTII